MKETLFLKLDRNLASPTESADGGKETIGEHSGADCLNSKDTGRAIRSGIFRVGQSGSTR